MNRTNEFVPNNMVVTYKPSDKNRKSEIGNWKRNLLVQNECSIAIEFSFVLIYADTVNSYCCLFVWFAVYFIPIGQFLFKL